MKRQIPNALTLARLVGAALFIALLSGWGAGDAGQDDSLLLIALGVFVVSVITDALDGYLARRWEVVSLFGRVMDPLADKIIVLGGFVMLASPAFVLDGRQISGIEAWMVVVILARELLVTAIRSVMEAQGIDFSASLSGKLKMVIQSVAIPTVLLLVWLGLRDDDQSTYLRLNTWIAWAVVVITVISGLPYVSRAVVASRSASQET